MAHKKSSAPDSSPIPPLAFAGFHPLLIVLPVVAGTLDPFPPLVKAATLPGLAGRLRFVFLSSPS